MLAYDTYYIAFHKNQPLKNEDLPENYEVTSENTLSGDFRIEQYFQKTQEIWDFSDFENAFKISIKRCQNISISSQVIGI